LNWWIGSTPDPVYAQGRLFFYGDDKAHGYARAYDRANGSPEAAADPFAIHLEEDPWLANLYLDAEHEDGYHRDQNAFGPGVSIEDDMAVLVRYASGASLTYHLTAYSPWEGYRLMVNGSKGRLELEVVENDHVSLTEGTEASWATLTVHPFWQQSYAIRLDHVREGHGGADARMVNALFGSGSADPLRRKADHRDGALSLVTGFAANQSFVTGQPVRTADLLDLPGV
jgi:hypothetical protein